MSKVIETKKADQITIHLSELNEAMHGIFIADSEFERGRMYELANQATEALTKIWNDEKS